MEINATNIVQQISISFLTIRSGFDKIFECSFNPSASGCSVFATRELNTWFSLTSLRLILLKFFINSWNFLLFENIAVLFSNFDQTRPARMILAIFQNLEYNNYNFFTCILWEKCHSYKLLNFKYYLIYEPVRIILYWNVAFSQQIDANLGLTRLTQGG